MARKKTQPKEKPGRYFIVNKAGAIHEVTKEDCEARLNQVGFRQATADEVKEYLARGGNQIFDDPICEPFKAEAKAVELEELDLSVLSDED